MAQDHMQTGKTVLLTAAVILGVLWFTGNLNIPANGLRGFSQSNLSGVSGPMTVAPPVVGTPAAPEASPMCDAGARYIAELGKCIYTMTDPVEVQKYSPDQAADPNCKGKPPGHRYTEKVTDEQGRVGTANKRCGRRPPMALQ